MVTSRSVLLRKRKASDKSCRGNKNTHFVYSIVFSKNCTVYGIMCRNTVERAMPQMTMWPMRIPCWISVHCLSCFFEALMMLKEGEAIYYKNHAKLTNSIRGQNEEDLNALTLSAHSCYLRSIKC
jgi:hypothetical protein